MAAFGAHNDARTKAVDPKNDPGTSDESTAGRRDLNPFSGMMTAVEDSGPVPWRQALLWCSLFAVIAAVFIESVTDGLPDDPIAWVITPLRLIIAGGLIAVVVAARRISVFTTDIDIPLAGLVVVSLASVVLADGNMASWRSVLTGIALFYLVVGIRRVLPPDGIRGIGTIAYVSVVTTSIVGVTQSFTDQRTGFCRALLNPNAEDCDAPGVITRAMGTHTNPNLLAAFIVLLLPFITWWAWQLEDYFTRLVALGGAGLAVLALTLTVSRQASLALLVGFGAFFVLSRPSAQRVRIGAMVAAGLIFILTVFMFTGLSALGLRSDIYRQAVKSLFREPLGVGLGNAGAALRDALPGALPYAHAHNLWANWLMEASLLGFLLWVAIPILLMRHLIRAARAGDRLAPYFAASIAGFVAVSMVDHPANASRIDYVMWFVFALAATAWDEDELIEQDIDEAFVSRRGPDSVQIPLVAAAGADHSASAPVAASPEAASPVAASPEAASPVAASPEAAAPVAASPGAVPAQPPDPGYEVVDFAAMQESAMEEPAMEEPAIEEPERRTAPSPWRQSAPASPPVSPSEPPAPTAPASPAEPVGSAEPAAPDQAFSPHLINETGPRHSRVDDAIPPVGNPPPTVEPINWGSSAHDELGYLSSPATSDVPLPMAEPSAPFPPPETGGGGVAAPGPATGGWHDDPPRDFDTAEQQGYVFEPGADDDTIQVPIYRGNGAHAAAQPSAPSPGEPPLPEPADLVDVTDDKPDSRRRGGRGPR